MGNGKKIIAFIMATIIIVGASVMLTALFVWIICTCFNIAFSWKLAIGIWAIQMMINLTFVRTSKD